MYIDLPLYAPHLSSRASYARLPSRDAAVIYNGGVAPRQRARSRDDVNATVNDRIHKLKMFICDTARRYRSRASITARAAAPSKQGGGSVREVPRHSLEFARPTVSRELSVYIICTLSRDA